jgi:hypothetical protein
MQSQTVVTIGRGELIIKRFMAILLLSILTASCSEHAAALSEKDYIWMTDDEIRHVFLQYTPVGSSVDVVKQVMHEKFGLHLHKGYVFRSEDNAQGIKIQPGDYYVDTQLAAYGWARNCFLAGEYVSARWLFDKNGILKNIQVVHYSDGV